MTAMDLAYGLLFLVLVACSVTFLSAPLWLGCLAWRARSPYLGVLTLAASAPVAALVLIAGGVELLIVDVTALVGLVVVAGGASAAAVMGSVYVLRRAVRRATSR